MSASTKSTAQWLLMPGAMLVGLLSDTLFFDAQKFMDLCTTLNWIDAPVDFLIAHVQAFPSMASLCVLCAASSILFQLHRSADQIPSGWPCILTCAEVVAMFTGVVLFDFVRQMVQLEPTLAKMFAFMIAPMILISFLKKWSLSW